MSLDLFRVGKGIELLSEDFTSRTNILTGTGAPGGDGAVQDNAPIGSLYLRQDVEADGLQVYFKRSLVNNSPADWYQAVDKNYVDNVAMGLSWREPVRVMDQAAYANAASIPTTGTIDGVILSDGERVLFTNIASVGQSNVYIWQAATTSWVEDANAETDGDAVLVQEGTFAEQQWVYDGVSWVQFGGAANTQELEFLRNFVGKTATGAEMPSFSSTDVVSPTANLEQAIGQLDAAIGTRSYVNEFVITDGEDITLSLDALDTAIGSRTYTEGNFTTTGESITASLDALDVAVGDLAFQNEVIKVANIVAETTVDAVPVTQVDVMEWRIVVEDRNNPARRTSSIYTAIHDGASNVDLTRYATVRRGTAIAGLSVDVRVIAGNLELIVSSTNGVDVGVKRLVALSAN